MGNSILAFKNYVGYAPIQFEIDFSTANAGTDGWANATIEIDQDDTIWAMYPLDGSDAPDQAFCITTAERVQDIPRSSIPVASFKVENSSRGCKVNIKYNSALGSGSGILYFNAYFWGGATPVGNSTVQIRATLDTGVSLTSKGTGFTSGVTGPANVTWTKKS